MNATPLTARAEGLQALWSSEGLIAAQAATVVASADAQGHPLAQDLEHALQQESYDFAPAVSALAVGRSIEALLVSSGLEAVADLSDEGLADTALMIVSQDSLDMISSVLDEVVETLMTLTEVHQLETVGTDLAQLLTAGLQTKMVIEATRQALPAQTAVPLNVTASVANALDLSVPELPWTVDRWPVIDQATTLTNTLRFCASLGLSPSYDEAFALLKNTDLAVETDALAKLHQAVFRALEAANSHLDQWQPTAALVKASDSEAALVQGALAKAREILEAQSEA